MKVPKRQREEEKKKEPLNEAKLIKSQEEYIAQILSDEAKNQIPPRTPVEMQFRTTGPKYYIARPPTAGSEITLNSAVDS